MEERRCPLLARMFEILTNFIFVSIVKLVNNFRSHPDILYYPNNVFYGGDLRAQGPPEVINAHTKWSHLPKKTFPIIFHAVYGEDKRESTSPSYFNIDEITQVKKYVKYLLNDKKVPISTLRLGLIKQRGSLTLFFSRG